MTLKELKQLSGRGEDQFTEFKQYASEPDQITEEIVGFLNARGGHLLIGIKDDGSLTGLKFPEDDLSFLLNYISEQIVPRFKFDSEIVPLSAKKGVIHIFVPEGKRKPYALINKDNKQKTVYYRVKDECIKASRELKSILRQANSYHGRTLVYSDIEAAVLKQIEQHGSLTKADLLNKIEFNSRKISDCLIRLVTSKILTITPATSGDLFAYKHPG